MYTYINVYIYIMNPDGTYIRDFFKVLTTQYIDCNYCQIYVYITDMNV